MSKFAFAFRSFPLLVTGAAAATIAACSATSNSQFTGSGGFGAGNATSSSSGDIGFGAGSQGGSSGEGGSNACAAEPHVAMQVPLDIYFMLDQSGSMSGEVSGGQSKWEAVTGALQSFLTQPGLSGISVGIQYFGVPPAGAAQCGQMCFTDADCGPAACGPCFGAFPPLQGVCFGAAMQGDSCDPLDYDKPEVEIAPLPGAAASLITSMGKHSPTTGTPTGPALQGAITHATTWLINHPGHAVIAVLATDGIPGSCSPTDAAGLSQIAAQGAGAGVKTFTIGVFEQADMPEGPDLLQAIATAGQGQSFNFSTSQNVGQAFLDALNVIRGAALGCQYNIPVPTSGQPDYGKVNVRYTPGGGGMSIVFDKYPDKASCPPNGDGWYYDDNAAPTLINLCDATCDKVSGDQKGKIDILLGCKSKEPT